MFRGEQPRALRLARIPRLAAIALLAVEQFAQHGRATLLGNHPRPLNPRRPVSNVLEVAAGKLRHPVLLSVEMEAGDGLIHATRIKMPLIAIASNRMLPTSTPFLQLFGDALIDSTCRCSTMGKSLFQIRTTTHPASAMHAIHGSGSSYAGAFVIIESHARRHPITQNGRPP